MVLSPDAVLELHDIVAEGKAIAAEAMEVSHLLVESRRCLHHGNINLAEHRLVTAIAHHQMNTGRHQRMLHRIDALGTFFAQES